MMPQQNPYQSANKRYSKRLFVNSSLGFEEVEARIIEPYIPPSPQPRVKEIQLINAPSHFHGTGFSAYKATLNLLFESKEAYLNYVTVCGGEHKFYDERGAIYLGLATSMKPVPAVATSKYKVEIVLSLIKKNVYDAQERFQYQDIEGHWAETNIEEMANLGLVTVATRNGEPVLYFKPNAYVTRAEFVTFLNRTRKLVTQQLSN